MIASTKYMVFLCMYVLYIQGTEGPNWNFVELKVKFLTEKFRVEMI